MSTVAVVGGHGQVARLLHPLLRDAGHVPVALVRTEAQRAALEAGGGGGAAARHRGRRRGRVRCGLRRLRRRRLRRRGWTGRQHRAQAHRRPRGLAEVDRRRPRRRHLPLRAGLRDRRRRTRPPTTPRPSGGPTSRPSATPTPRCARATWPGRSCAPAASPTTPAPAGWRSAERRPRRRPPRRRRRYRRRRARRRGVGRPPVEPRHRRRPRRPRRPAGRRRPRTAAASPRASARARGLLTNRRAGAGSSADR